MRSTRKCGFSHLACKVRKTFWSLPSQLSIFSLAPDIPVKDRALVQLTMNKLQAVLQSTNTPDFQWIMVNLYTTRSFLKYKVPTMSNPGMADPRWAPFGNHYVMTRHMTSSSSLPVADLKANARVSYLYIPQYRWSIAT